MKSLSDPALPELAEIVVLLLSSATPLRLRLCEQKASEKRISVLGNETERVVGS